MANEVRHMDVVICGAGVIGTCTAYYLAKKGVFSIVIEKDEVANAASGKAGGFLAEDWNKGSALNELSKASFALHAALADELDGKNHYGYRKLDSHAITLDEAGKYNKTCHNKLPSWLDGDAIQNPAMKIGSTDTNAQVHPHEFCQTLRQCCSNMGVVFLTHSEVSHIAYSAADKTKVITLNNSKEISADVVVIAMGPWSGNAKKWFPTITSSIYGQKGHSITIYPTVPLTSEAIFASYGDLSPDIYPRPDGEAYVCGIVETPTQSAKLESPGAVCVTPGACARLKTLSGMMSSFLRDGKTTIEQACYLPLTEDGFPIIGKVPQFERVYIAAGHSCWGILNGPATGRALAELIVDGKSSIDISAFSPDRFPD